MSVQELLAPIYLGAKIPDQTQDDFELQSPSAEFEEGLGCWDIDQIDQADKLLRRACEISPNDYRPRAAYASLLAEQGDYKQALSHLRVLCRLRKPIGPVELATGLCYEKISQPDSAAIHYRLASELDEFSTEPLYRLAAINLHLGQPEQAAVQYEKMCKIIPEDTWLRTMLGNLYLLADMPEKAAKEFETFIAMEPENWAYTDPEITSLVSAGNFREAIRVAKTQIKEQGPFSDLLLQLANLYSMVGDDEPAVEYYTQALNQQPGYLEAAIKLATHHLLFGRIEESAEWFGLASVYSERLTASYIGLAVAHSAAGENPQAARSIELAAAVEPNSSLLLSQMINLHWKLANMDEIQQMLKQGDTNDTRWRDQLQCHDQFVSAHPENVLARFQYGVLLRAAGNHKLAVEQFKQVLRIDPGFTSALIKLGVIYTQESSDIKGAHMFHRLFYGTQSQIDFYYKLGVKFTIYRGIDSMLDQVCEFFSLAEQQEVNQALVTSLIDMGLYDYNSASWRTLVQTHKLGA